ncbi:MAG: S8 family serine peptidase [Candidatus Thermoplasmatota archaeon]|nr:S8 family serine peptidase [Candidatus Thermoplasmatota archaeon]
MRRVNLSVGLVILFVMSTYAPFFGPPAQPDFSTPQEQSEIQQLTFPSSTIFSPNLEYWTSLEMAEPMILTRDLRALHEWQILHDILPEQAPGILQEVSVSSGILEHRRVKMPGHLVAKLAGVEGVFAVYDDSTGPEPVGALSGSPNSVKSGQIHGAVDAWERGYNGSGVRVAVADSGIDFAHPDLNGTQAILDDSSSPYDGWSIMHDPISLVRWQRDGLAYPSAGNSWWVDTTNSDSDTDNDSLLDNQGWDISNAPVSVSGVYHFGEHSDSKLIQRAGGTVYILVIDTQISGVYDTILIDIDRDGEFGDESPVNKTNPTYGRDTNDDGLWDQSAGLLWWISDGVNGVPYGDVYAARNGYQNRVAGAGELILLMLNDASEAGGNHGTLCASAVSAQGVVSNGAVLGMAPGAELIAVSNLYAGGSWLDSFRFISEGYDGNATTSHDQGHIGSFSFGNSAAHDDGADYWSLYLDWLTRVHSPQTTYFVAVGNGGHGYGTTASPGGAHGVISVGAFSSKGSTWGESASWSNRGPNSVSRLDPDIVAVGWSATGDRTLNEVTNANNAYTTWGGTSLATPIAAGLAAVMYEAWFNATGTWPDSQTFRDLVMSTADDRGYDPLVQGGGWMNASRAVQAIDGEEGSLVVSPGSWMTGENEGAHRDGNLNFILPGQNQTMQLTLSNTGPEPMDVSLVPSELVPVAGHQMIWNSTDQGNNTTWDGHQSRPDWAFPLHIHGDANFSLPPEATLVRARAVMEGEGFDGNQNLQSENRLHLRIYRWTDNDGDGNWTTDSDNDSYVDDGEWTETNELDMITEHVYESGQVEARVGNPHDWEGDGLIVALWRQFVREPNKDPLRIEFDWTAFGPANDSWISAPSNLTIAPQSTSIVNVTIDVPQTARGGLKQHGLQIEAETNNTTRAWTWPVITNVAFSGPFSITPSPIDGNISNQTLYEETWLQGAQRWGWRAESGDWKFLTLDWPTTLSGNGSIMIDVDWPDNPYTDVDIHWMSEADHPFYIDNPLAYGPRTVVMETGSVGQHQGGGKYGHYTNGGGSREIIIADDTPGTKQMMLHSAMHGVNTNDNPLNISVGYITPLGSGFTTTLTDWAQNSGVSAHRIGSTMDLDIAGISGTGFTIPQYLSSETVYQDDPGDVTSSSYIREFIADTNEMIEMEIGCHQSGIDLDLYLYRDANGNGILDWGNEQVGSSGNFNCDESISYTGGQGGTYWAVVHGYDLRASNTTFWLKWSEIGGSDLTVQGFSTLNSTQIQAQYPNGSNALAGSIPQSVVELNLSWNRPMSAGNWGGFVDLTLNSGGLIRLPYTFVLIDPAPETYFSLPNGTRTNQSIPISMYAHDQGTGFNISGLSFDIGSHFPGSLPSFATLETVTVDGQYDSNSIDLWNHWNSNRNFSAGNHYSTENGFHYGNASSNGALSLEAESAMQIIEGAGPIWEISNAGENYSGTGFVTSTADGFDSGNLTNGSRLFWDVEFDAIGTYSVVVRIKQHDAQANGIYLGLNGQVSGDFNENQSSNYHPEVSAISEGWNWIEHYVNVTTSGRHTFDIWVKESGVQIDRINILQNNQFWSNNNNWWWLSNSGASSYPAPSPLWEDVTLRSAWLNWSLPSDNQWHDYSSEVIDITNRIDSAELFIEHDDVAPPIVIHNWRDFTNQSILNDTWVITDPEATLWLNGTEIPIDSGGRANLELLLQPTIWGQSMFGQQGNSNMWDTSTWTWHGLNMFSLTTTDPAGNWNHANLSMAYDPWAPSNAGPSPQLSFDSIRLLEWDSVNVPVNPLPYNMNLGEFFVSRIFDGYEICLSAFAPSGQIMEVQCQIDEAPPWEETPGSNRPVMEENRFLFNFTDWPDSLYEIELKVTDWANNVGTHQASILIDRTAPEIDIHEPQNSQNLIDHHLNIQWNVSETSYQWVEIDDVVVWSSGQYGTNNSNWLNGSQSIQFSLNRTGSHNLCISAADLAGISISTELIIQGSNMNTSCVEFNLPEETYWPTLDAPWNNTHVNTTRVWVDLTLGPDQSYRWWQTIDSNQNLSEFQTDNGSYFTPENGSIRIPIDLDLGMNYFVFHLDALEKTFVYELNVFLDLLEPELVVEIPHDGYATFQSIAIVSGHCEAGLSVYVNVSGLYSQQDCTANGTFEIEASLPLSEGVWPMVTHQVDLAGNRMIDARLIVVDKTAPSANLVWNQTECNREPTAPVWGTANPADCTVSVDLSIISDDIVEWSISIINDGENMFSQSGTGSDFIGMKPETFAIAGPPGGWVVEVELKDAASNRQRLKMSTSLDAPEATIGEHLKTPGSVHNLVATVLFGTLLLAFQMRARARQAKDTGRGDVAWLPSHSEFPEENLAIDSMFEDDVVVSSGESTLSNTE